MKTKLLITCLALIALTTMASAQNQGAGQKKQNQTGRESAWVDANKDGLCDNYGTQKSSGSKGYGQGNGNGMGQGKKQGMGQCRTGQGPGNQKNFVDTDKNGVCDLREAPVTK